MKLVQRTDIFSRWLDGLKDERAKARIAIRIDRLALDNPGDAKSVGAGVMELRIPYGPGYRAYYTQQGDILIVLLCGGDKGSQDRDIRTAKALKRDLEQ